MIGRERGHVDLKHPTQEIISQYLLSSHQGQLNSYLVGYAPSKEHPIGGLSVAQLAWMCQQPCEALEYLASRSVVHRDVSARNCLVGRALQVCASVCLYVCMFVCVFVCLSVCLFFCSSVCLFVCVFDCLFVCFCVSVFVFVCCIMCMCARVCILFEINA